MKEVTGQSEMAYLIDKFHSFCRIYWKFAIMGGAIGAAVGTFQALNIEDRYIFKAQISMHFYPEYIEFISLNPSGINLEKPMSLIGRMANPMFYSLETLSSCGLTDTLEQRKGLIAKLKLLPAKNNDSEIEVEFTSNSRDAGGFCINAIIENIKQSQNDIYLPFENSLKSLNQDIKSKIRDGLSVKSFNDESKRINSEMFFLPEKIDSILKTSEFRKSRLVLPIYFEFRPAESSYLRLITFRFLSGLFIGFLTGYFFKNLKAYYSKK